MEPESRSFGFLSGYKHTREEYILVKIPIRTHNTTQLYKNRYLVHLHFQVLVNYVASAFRRRQYGGYTMSGAFWENEAP